MFPFIGRFTSLYKWLKIKHPKNYIDGYKKAKERKWINNNKEYIVLQEELKSLKQKKVEKEDRLKELESKTM